MDDHELEQLLVDLELDRVERKASLADPDRIREVICAFANDLPDHRKPGVLFVGVHDDGSCAGLAITDQLLQSLAAMRADGNILPFPVMQVRKTTLRGCEIAVVLVEPAEAPPVRCRGRVWVRVGPRRAVATPAEERRLAEKRRCGDRPFDLRPVRGATLSDLDIESFRRVYLPASVAPDVLAENTRSAEEQLAAMRFCTPDTSCPTVLGILVVGRNPTDWIPGAYLEFVRFDGADLTAPVVDEHEIRGTIIDVLRRLDELLELNIRTPVEIVAERREVRRPDYPLVALQQLARNAILHRDYETSNAPVRVNWYADRIEIHNPGGPFGQVTAENLGQPGVTDYRNPHLAEAMKYLGYVQRFGVGIALARKALADNANPSPRFDVAPNHVLVTIFARP